MLRNEEALKDVEVVFGYVSIILLQGMKLSHLISVFVLARRGEWSG